MNLHDKRLILEITVPLPARLSFRLEVGHLGLTLSVCGVPLRITGRRSRVPSCQLRIDPRLLGDGLDTLPVRHDDENIVTSFQFGNTGAQFFVGISFVWVFGFPIRCGPDFQSG